MKKRQKQYGYFIHHLTWITIILFGIVTGIVSAPAVAAKKSSRDAGIQGVRLEPVALPEFRLQDQREAGFTGESLKGRWHVLLFGFTHCPHICPMHLAHIKGMRAQLLERGYSATALPDVVLVSVDPARDTPERLRAYLKQFDPDFIGVTGDITEIKRLEKFLGAAHRLFSKDVDGNYDVMHSTYFYLINPEGLLVAKLAPPFNADILAKGFIGVAGDPVVSVSANVSR